MKQFRRTASSPPETKTNEPITSRRIASVLPEHLATQTVVLKPFVPTCKSNEFDGAKKSELGHLIRRRVFHNIGF